LAVVRIVRRYSEAAQLLSLARSDGKITGSLVAAIRLRIEDTPSSVADVGVVSSGTLEWIVVLYEVAVRSRSGDEQQQVWSSGNQSVQYSTGSR
jgi:hypothetical protein